MFNAPAITDNINDIQPRAVNWNLTVTLEDIFVFLNTNKKKTPKTNKPIDTAKPSLESSRLPTNPAKIGNSKAKNKKKLNLKLKSLFPNITSVPLKVPVKPMTEASKALPKVKAPQ